MAGRPAAFGGKRERERERLFLYQEERCTVQPLTAEENRSAGEGEQVGKILPENA